MRRFYPRQRINLTGRPEWKRYTLEDEHLGRLVMESTMATMDSLNADDVAHYAQRFVKTLITHEQKANLFAAWKDQRLELFRSMLTDISDWAWADAYTPTDLDVEKALRSGVWDVTSSYFKWLDEYPALLDVALAVGYNSQSKFVTDLLTKDTIYIEDQGESADRFLIYDPTASALIERIATQPISPPAAGVLDWEPTGGAWNESLRKDFSSLFGQWKDTTIEKLFHYLRIRMNDLDYNSRMHFDFHEFSHKSAEARAIRKEIQDALNGSPSLGANPFMNPRNRRLERDFMEMTALAAASPIMEFEALGDPPEKYRIRFRGLGLDPDGKLRDLHEVIIDLNSEYPRGMPRIHWHTPILHPNISGGTPCFGNFTMNPRVRLVDLVEILWDMNRMAIYNAHGNQESWNKIRKTIDFPVDPRTIRGEVPRAPESGGDVDLIIMGR